MRIFNQVLATLISLGLIAGAALGIVYLIGFLTGTTALTQLVDSWFRSIAGLNTGQIQAILLGTFVISFVLLLLQIVPWRAQSIIIRDDSMGRTQLFRADVEMFLAQRLSKEKIITPERLDVLVRGNKFDVAAGVAVSTTADIQEMRLKVERDVRDNLESIGLDEDLKYVETRVSRLKRVA